MSHIDTMTRRFWCYVTVCLYALLRVWYPLCTSRESCVRGYKLTRIFTNARFHFRLCTGTRSCCGGKIQKLKAAVWSSSISMGCLPPRWNDISITGICVADARGEDNSCHALHPTPYTLHSTLYTLHSTPYTLHPTLYTLHSTLYTLHPIPHILNS